MAAATMYVTPAGAGTKAGNDWDNAMGLAEFETDVEGAAEAGDIYYVAGGTYTLTNAISTTLDGTAAAPITIIGVASGTSNEPPVFADWASGDGRPLFACGSYNFTADDYWQFFNLRGTANNATQVFRADKACRFVNCKAEQSSTGAGIYTAGTLVAVIGCEGVATSGIGIRTSSTDCFLLGCYAHDSTTGFLADSSCLVAFCVAETCGVGISFGSDSAVWVLNCTINSNTTGVESATSESCVLLNNIISNNTTGVSFAADYDSNYLDYNDWYSNTTDVSNVTKGNNALAVDPQFTNAAGGDFSLAAASALIGAGFSIELGVG